MRNGSVLLCNKKIPPISLVMTDAIEWVQGIINCDCFHGLSSIFTVIQKTDEG